jgi:non-ribosomal peptide synthetase component F
MVRDRALLTYEELERRANQMARMLRDHGCRRGDRVVVLASTTPAAVVAMLGALKADAIYVPLSVQDPPTRLAAAVSASRPACLLLSGQAVSAAEALVQSGTTGGATFGSLDDGPIVGQGFSTKFSLADAVDVPDRGVASRNRGGNPACLVFSEVGTDEARGVVTTHANFVRSVLWTTTNFEIRPGDRCVAMSPVARDHSLHEVMTAFAAGAVLVAVPTGLAANARQLAAFVRRSAVSHWWTTTDAFGLLANADVVSPGDFPLLRHVIWWGTSVPRASRQYWMRRVGHARFTALYGRPEAAIASAWHEWAIEGDPTPGSTPIGRPCAGQEVVVLDERLESVGAGEPGDLWIRGLGLSPGNWGDSLAVDPPQDAGRRFGMERLCRTGDRGFRTEDGVIYVTHSPREDNASREPLADGVIQRGVRPSDGSEPVAAQTP